MGSVQVQPQPVDSTSYQAQKQTTTSASPQSAGVVPVRQASLSVPTMQVSSDSVNAVKQTTISDIVTNLSKDGVFVFPLGSKVNNIVPTFATSLDAGKVFDPRAATALATTTTKFQPFESLTGLAQERPEIIMLTNFQPIFNTNVANTAPQYINAFEQSGQMQFMTDAGQYIDSQFNMRNLMVFNVSSNIRFMIDRYPVFNQAVSARRIALTQGINDLWTDVTFLLNVVRMTESQRSQLDMRSDLYTVQAQEFVNFFNANYRSTNPSISPNSSQDLLALLIAAGTLPSFNCVDGLIDLGYASDNVKKVYTSTKIWLQMLLETKQMIKHHTLKLLDINPLAQKQDNTATKILGTSAIKYFGISPTLPASLPSLSKVVNLKLADVNATVKTIATTYGTLYQNVFFKNEEMRIVALAELLSKEYKYSYGLGLTSVQELLEKSYSYKVKDDGNTGVFDAIFGNFGNNISDFPKASDVSLVSIAQNQSQGKKVLSFEPTPVKGDPSSISSGGTVYIDSVLDLIAPPPTNVPKFNTGALDKFGAELQQQYSNFLYAIDGFNLLSFPAFPDPTSVGASLNSSDFSFLTNAGDIFNTLVAGLVDVKTGHPLPDFTNDRLGAVYAQARTNPQIKSMLFLYTMAKISRAYGVNVPFFIAEPGADNTPTVDFLIDLVNAELQNTIKYSSTAASALAAQQLGDKNAFGGQTANGRISGQTLTPAAITSAMKDGTVTTFFVELFMSLVIDLFQVKSTAMKDGKTRYSNHTDTTIMMVAFDLVITMIAKFSNEKIVGVTYGAGPIPFMNTQLIYIISQTTANHRVALSQIKQKQLTEDNTSRRMIITIVNVMRTLSGAMQGLSNYLNSTLSSISATLNNDPVMIKQLLNEQQVMLLASIVNSLVTANNANGISGGNTGQSPSTQSYQRGTNSQEIAILDESDVPLQMKNALYGFFGKGDFASPEAVNKHILTVGIPAGFTKSLKLTTSLQVQKKSTYSAKQNDMVQVTVYKVDMQNPDIVYKPQRFMFELSRFPTRVTTAQWLPMSSNPSISNIINAIPTQNYSLDLNSSTSVSVFSGVEYAAVADGASLGIKGTKVAFSDPSYSFLTSQQKSRILYNHIVSQLLETYIKLMTGINVAEYNYHMQDPPPPVEPAFIKQLTEFNVKYVTDTAQFNVTNALSAAAKPPAGGTLFSTTGQKSKTSVNGTSGNKATTSPVLSNPSGVAGSVNQSSANRGAQPAKPQTRTLAQQSNTGNTSSNLDTLTHHNVPTVLSSLQTVSQFSNMLTSISDVNALNKMLLTPKQFDRVFNVIVDGRDFQVDVTATCATPFGKQAFNLLLANGDIIPNSTDVVKSTLDTFLDSLSTSNVTLTGRSFPQGGLPNNINNYRYRDRDKTQGDLIFDEYFVTIETYDENS